MFKNHFSIREKYLKIIFDIWVDWERKTVALYEEAIDHCRKEKHERGILVLEKYLKDVTHELNTLEKQYTDFEMAEWCPCKILLLNKE